MKRTILALFVAVIWNLLTHFLPIAYDVFTPIVFQGDQIKVFYRGWPLKYVAEGPLRDPISTVFLKSWANILISAVVVWLMLTAFARIRSGKRFQRVMGQTHSSRFFEERKSDEH
jgi:hypothetical protein